MIADQPAVGGTLLLGQSPSGVVYAGPQGGLGGRHATPVARSLLLHLCLRKLVRVSSMADSSAVTKAVVPAAGLGTRFLPATKATPKEMLPIVDKPAIQYVVEEAVSAGLDDVLLITGRSKRSIEDHFDRAYELEEALAAKEDWDKLSLVREPSDLATMHYVRQGDPKGLGHAVLCAAQHVGSDPFAVLLGDDLIDARDPLLTRMIDIRNEFGGSVVALMQVEPEEVSLYGCAAVEATGEDDMVMVTDLVEKPPAGTAPSRWIVIGRYVC